jgi:TetR/AcrR family transcriptional repressor of nem operon
MVKRDSESARERLIAAGTELIRRNGYVATTVDEICAEAGATKGAFFHYFASKEALAQACLTAWKQGLVTMLDGAPFQSVENRVDKLSAAMDFLIGVFSDPSAVKSCLAGTVAQEVSESHPALRESAQLCFAAGESRFKSLLEDACREQQIQVDSASLAKLWIATLQGSFLLAKASRDDAVVPASLTHIKQYILSLVDAPAAAKR